MYNDDFKTLLNLPDQIAKEVYSDLAKPSFNELGVILKDTISSLKFLALPFKMLGLSSEVLFEKYKSFLIETVKKVPHEKIQSPPQNVAGPLFENVKYSFEIQELKNLYSNLLASSMNQDFSKSIHPAFVEIISQMSPIEARIIAYFKTKAILPFVYLSFTSTTAIPMTLEAIEPFSKIENLDIDYLSMSSSLKNLERLGLIKLTNIKTTEDKPHIENILKDEVFQSYFETKKYLEENNLKIQNIDMNIVHGNILLTNFGVRFKNTCL